jgi:hypothetical protein
LVKGESQIKPAAISTGKLMPSAFASVFGRPIVRLGARLAPPLARDHPERREDGSGIRRKVESQRHAECKIKRDAGCDCNSGRIHFPTPYALMSVCPTMKTWVVKMVPLSLENGRLGF